MQFMQNVALPILTILMSSAGLWGFLTSRKQAKAADTTKQAETLENMKFLVMGLGYDVLVSRGMEYISRGWITKDEYEDFVKLFYDPYKALGGNGVAEQIMNQIRKLPFDTPGLYFELRKPRQEYNDERWTTQGLNHRHAIEQPRL